MERNRRTALRTLVLVVDALLVAVSMGASFGAHALLRTHIPQLREPPSWHEYAAIAFLALPLWPALAAFTGAHRIVERVWSRAEILVSLLKLHVLGLITLSIALFITQSVINRSLVAVFLLSSFLLMLAERWIVTAWVRHQHHHGHGRSRLLLVGADGPAMRKFARSAVGGELPVDLVGVLTPESRVDDDEGTDGSAREAFGPDEAPLPAPMGSVTELGAVLHDEAVDEVVFFPPCDDPHQMVDALERCETIGVPASFALELDPLRRAAPHLRRAYGQSFVTFEVASKSPALLAIKHAFDVVAAAILLVLLSPVLLFTTLAIAISMGRPILFSQPRAGLRGREFSMIKFRTMVADAEAKKQELESQNEMSGPVFKVTDDPRVTRLGRFLRKSSIDELPQLFNVLTGTMSLVGPRPLPVEEQKRIVGWHRRRLAVKPGITCLWQIGGRSDVDFEQWMMLDLQYVDDWSLGLDLAILLKTVPVVLLRRGAR